MADFVVGQKVSFVRTVQRGSGFKLTTTKAKIESLGKSIAVVKLRNGHLHRVRLSALSAEGQLRDLAAFVDDAVKAADPMLAEELLGLAEQVRTVDLDQSGELKP